MTRILNRVPASQAGSTSGMRQAVRGTNVPIPTMRPTPKDKRIGGNISGGRLRIGMPCATRTRHVAALVLKPVWHDYGVRQILPFGIIDTMQIVSQWYASA